MRQHCSVFQWQGFEYGEEMHHSDYKHRDGLQALTIFPVCYCLECLCMQPTTYSSLQLDEVRTLMPVPQMRKLCLSLSTVCLCVCHSHTHRFSQSSGYVRGRGVHGDGARTVLCSVM